MELVAATGNINKVREFKEIFGGRFAITGIHEIVPVFDPEETGLTFAENALIKARTAYAMTGRPCFADDSGLCVDALGGEPGIHSARYAPPGSRKATLLSKLEGLPKEKRTAHFTCAFAYCDGVNELMAEGSCFGYILESLAGNGGFGYDPIFYSFELDKSFGEAEAEEKNKISHRAKAAKLFLEKLEQQL